jgi:hypothetical protein
MKKYIAILALLVLSVCVSVYFVMGNNDKKYQEPVLKKLPERTPDEVERLKNELETGEVLMIESGAVMAEEQSTSTTETYVQRPELHLCNPDRLKSYVESCKPFVSGPCPVKDKKTQQLNLPSYCNVIEDPDNTSAFVYDLKLKDSKFSEYKSCPDGTHNCWYVEEFDEEGTLVGVKNRNGDNFLDVLVDDIWNDLWVEETVWGEKTLIHNPQEGKKKCPEGSRRRHGFKDCYKVVDTPAYFIRDVSYLVELRDGKLYAKKDFPERNLKYGDLLTFGNMEPVQYYLAMFLLMKLAGLPKPKKVKLNVRNAKLNNQKFMKMRIISEDGSSFMGAEAGISLLEGGQKSPRAKRIRPKMPK